MVEEAASATDVMHCARHPKVETGLTCATCRTPICPSCLVVTPVGMKCPACGKAGGGALFQVRPERLALAALTAVVAGAIAGATGLSGFFVFFLSAPYGYFAGMMILKASGMKRGLKLEIVAGAGMVVGAIAARIIPSLVVAGLMAKAGAPGGELVLLRSMVERSFLDLFFWAAVVISTGAAVSKIRYL